MKNKKLVFIVLGVVLALVGGFAAYSKFAKPADPYLYAYDPQTKQRVSEKPLLFLYAINSTTGEVKTYSPVTSDIVANSDRFVQTAGKADAQATQTGRPANITRVVLNSGDNPSNEKEGFLPALSWVDLQGLTQRQFFVQGVDVVYVSDQPLKENEDKTLSITFQLNQR